MSDATAKLNLTTRKKNQMKNLINTLSEMNNDIDFVKTISVYAYLIIASVAMLVGIAIGGHH